MVRGLNPIISPTSLEYFPFVKSLTSTDSLSVRDVCICHEKPLTYFLEFRYRDGRRLEKSNAAVLVEHQATAKNTGRYACEVNNAEGASRCEEIFVSVNAGKGIAMEFSDVS